MIIGKKIIIPSEIASLIDKISSLKDDCKDCLDIIKLCDDAIGRIREDEKEIIIKKGDDRLDKSSFEATKKEMCKSLEAIAKDLPDKENQLVKYLLKLQQNIKEGKSYIKDPGNSEKHKSIAQSVLNDLEAKYQVINTAVTKLKITPLISDYKSNLPQTRDNKSEFNTKVVTDSFTAKVNSIDDGPSSIKSF